ncbi:XdhC family protein [Nocardia vermiculata]|uniref:XdhC family protein n=1 Tax=Nocardia vermiculata TaxID=257274 RepID=A0A846Y1X4_9NOCA|nr:XdhC family protein [Nocardia vermiculata]NKY51980.1 XdhC family protein [Nocardia vermiculata]
MEFSQEVTVRELGGQLRHWHAAGTGYALATVIGVRGSAPRPVGTTMAVDESGQVHGSVSGGCVEGAVYEECLAVIASGQPTLHTFGYSADDAFAVGLTCGGELDVFICRITETQYAAVESALVPDGPVALVYDLESGELAAIRSRTGVGADFDPAVLTEARAMLDTATTGVRTIGCTDRERTVFAASFAPAPRMIIFGATDFTTALCQVGRLLGYRVTVCEPRPIFAERARLPDADEVVRDRPDRYLRSTQVDSRTVICVLTHDPKFDIPVLSEALRLPVAYVGAMGSRRSDRERRRELRAGGISEAELFGLHSPIGLELGGRTPGETAVSIAAEIVAGRRGGSGRPLCETDRPIHTGTELAC